jgi:hypothetical protein
LSGVYLELVRKVGAGAAKRDAESPSLVTKKTLVLAAVLLGMIGMIERASAVTEVARTPWQSRGTTVCADFQCRIYFPQVAAKQRLDIQYVSCAIGLSADVPIHYTTLGIDDAFGGVRHLLIWNRRVQTGQGDLLDISQPIVSTISAGHRPQIGWGYVSGAFTVGPCALSGELVFLQ